MTWHPEIPLEYRNQIVTGDARELTKEIPDESIDLIFTSPPYNVGMNYGKWNDNLPKNEFWDFQKQWLCDAFRVARDSSRLYAIVGDEMLWHFREIAEAIGWKFHQLLVWCKPNIVNSSRITKDWSMLIEWGLLFHKSKRTNMLSDIKGINTHNWIIQATPQSNFSGNNKRVLPAQMPVRVALSWLARTPGKIVFEPFAGSGTTCIATKLLNRNYIAFEIDPDTAELARERVRNTQPPLFVLEPEQLELKETDRQE